MIKSYFKINGLQKLAVIFFLLLMTSCAQPIPRRPISHHTKSIMKESVELNKKINADEEKAIMYYIAQDSTNHYLSSSTGFWYTYLYQINDEKPFPIFGDEVVFEYEILDLSSNIIYAKDKLGTQQYIIDKEDIEVGLQNGLKLMKENEEVLFLFPSFNAFGISGDQQKIGINQPLVYKVKLIKINN